MRSFAFKVNRKEKRAALRAALSAHASEGTLALFDSAGFDAPSTRAAADLIGHQDVTRAPNPQPVSR